MVHRRQLTIRGLAFFVGLILFPSSGAVEAAWGAPATAGDSIHNGQCAGVFAGRQVTLDINPKPVSHMKELTFSLTIDPCTPLPDSLQLDLAMPGMFMGQNRVTLAKTGKCSYTGKGIIVRCMSGRTLWQATLLLPELGNPAFTFNARN